MFRTGIIEGFYGEPFTWEQRAALLPFLAQHGFTFYLYAPKAEAHLRRLWREPFPEPAAAELDRFAAAARSHGIAFGVGLSPLDLHASWDDAGRDQLLRRVEELGRFDWLALLFDDMVGDIPGLANTQGAILREVRAATSTKLLMCPSYYTSAGVLDRIFGQRPERYLEDLGAALDPDVDVFWTGPKVCSTEYPDEHLQMVATQLGRKPFLWDNYPVNDGPKMCKKLHLRPFTGRGPAVREHTAGLAVNPMNEVWLNRLVLATLNRCLDGRPSDALDELLPADLAAMLRSDIEQFQDSGLDELDVQPILQRYAGFEHPAASEIRGWLRGEYTVGPECLTDV